MPFLLTASPTVRSRITLSDLRDRVRGDLAMRGNNKITDTDLMNWANEAQDLIARELLWLKAHDTIDVVAGTAEYTLPLQCVAVTEVLHNDLPLLYRTIQEIINYNPYWRNASEGTPIFYYIDSASMIGLHPTPSDDLSAGVTVHYRYVPPQVTDPDDNYYVPFGGEDAIILYAKMMACEKDASGEGERRWPMYNQRWKERFTELKRQVEEMAESDVVVFGQNADYGRYPRHKMDYEGGTPISKPGFTG